MNTFLLKLAGGLGLLIAAFQAALSFSPSLSAYWGAGEELTSNRLLLLALGLTVTGLFALGAAYALSGAGLLPRLPLLRLGLLTVGAVYMLRGLPAIPLLLTALGILPATEPIALTASVSGAVALIVGLLYLGGTVAGWRRLSGAARSHGAGSSLAGNRPGPMTS
jgi:hypothetical protein